MYQNSSEDNEIREANRKKVELYFRVPHNSPEQLELYDPDCEWEQPYFRPDEVTRLFPAEDGEPPMDFPEGFEPPEFTPEWTWDDNTQIWGTDDPNFFFASNTGHGLQLTADNTLKPYHNRYFHTFQFRNGKIVFYREIANPLALMETMGCKFEPLPRPEETLGKLIELYKSQHSEK